MFGTSVYLKKKKAEHMYQKLIFLIRTKIKKKLNREERRDETEERRQNEKKKLISSQKKDETFMKKVD